MNQLTNSQRIFLAVVGAAILIVELNKTSHYGAEGIGWAFIFILGSLLILPVIPILKIPNKKIKKPTVEFVVESARHLIELQLLVRYPSLPKAFSSIVSNKAALGYLFGFHDYLFQKAGLHDPDDSKKTLILIKYTYQRLFGDNAGGLIYAATSACLKEEDFLKGDSEGANDIRDYLNEKTPPLGLNRILTLNSD